jgi:hypothetical protein
MLGIPEEENENRRNRLAYWLTVNTLGCTPEDEPAAAELAGWLEPANRPLPLRDQPVESFLGADAAACRAALSQRFRQEADALRELHTQVVKDVDEPAMLEVLQCASILKDDAARRVLRAHADVRATFHKAWRDLVTVLESDEEEGLSDFDENDDQNEDNDEDASGGADVTAEAPAEAVIPEEPAAVSTGEDGVPEPQCGEHDDFLPFQPEKIVEQSAQPSEAVAACVESSDARVGCAKWVPAGGKERPNGVQNPRAAPDFAGTAPAVPGTRPSTGIRVPPGLGPRESATIPGVVHRAPADDDPGGTLIGKDPGGAGAVHRATDPLA